MNFQEQEQFFQMVSRLRANSKAASEPKDDVRVTEMINGVLVSKPAKKIEYLSEPSNASQAQTEAQVWNLTKNGPVLESKAASVNSINKMKAIHDIITFHY